MSCKMFETPKFAKLQIQLMPRGFTITILKYFNNSLESARYQRLIDNYYYYY